MNQKQHSEIAEFFEGIPKIQFDSRDSTNLLTFKEYNPKEMIMGKPMIEWCRFSICFWHTMRWTGSDMFGSPSLRRPWDDGSDSIENAQRRLCAMFELMSKLGVQFWTFHDRDIAPEGKTLEETNRNLDQIVVLAKKLQDKYGIKCLWGTANLFSHPRYMNGAATSPDSHVFAYACAQVKKAMEVTKFLGGEGFVFWGGREGFHTLLNTDVKREMDHYAAFLKMAAQYKKQIGFTGGLFVEPKPKEPTKHQYDYDAQTVIGFLKMYSLDKEFKLNIEPNHTTLAGHSYEHDIVIASKLGMLGTVDCNTGSPDLGWDTDQFPMDVKNATLVMKAILEQGGLPSGGLNFDCKVRRESTNLQDYFLAHIGAMDTMARGLRNAAKLLEDGRMAKMVSERYASFDKELGHKVEKGQTSFEEMEQFCMKQGEPSIASGEQEKYELVLNLFVR
jgi:xylose isomerase